MLKRICLCLTDARKLKDHIGIYVSVVTVSEVSREVGKGGRQTGMAAEGSSKGGLYLCNWERVGTWLQELSFNQPDCMQLPYHCHFYYCYYCYFYYFYFYYY